MPKSSHSAVQVPAEEWAVMQRRLREAEEKLALFEQQHDEFLAMLAHELRNPLAPIRSAVEIMRMVGPRDAALEKACELIARQVDQLSEVVGALSARQAARAEPPPRAGGREMPRRILVIDDNKDAAESMAMLLRLKGHEVHIAYDGIAGVATALQTRCDCVLVDIGLPDIDGYEVARRVRSHDKDSAITLIALTGYGQPEDRLQSEAAGFDHYVVKPVTQQALDELLMRR